MYKRVLFPLVCSEDLERSQVIECPLYGVEFSLSSWILVLGYPSYICKVRSLGLKRICFECESCLAIEVSEEITLCQRCVGAVKMRITYCEM